MIRERSPVPGPTPADLSARSPGPPARTASLEPTPREGAPWPCHRPHSQPWLSPLLIPRPFSVSPIPPTHRIPSGPIARFVQRPILSGLIPLHVSPLSVPSVSYLVQSIPCLSPSGPILWLLRPPLVPYPVRPRFVSLWSHPPAPAPVRHLSVAPDSSPCPVGSPLVPTRSPIRSPFVPQ